MEPHELKPVRTELRDLEYRTRFDDLDVKSSDQILFKARRFSAGMDTSIQKMLEKVSVMHGQKQALDKLISQTQEGLDGFKSRQYESRRKAADSVISGEILRIRVFGRDGWACRKCGTSDFLTIDHILPVRRGGGNDDDNLQTLCRSCNSSKGAK